jgi:hypothetical protein
MGPLLKKSLKKAKKQKGPVNTRSGSIPVEILNTDMIIDNLNERKIIMAMYKVLADKGLAGEGSILVSMAEGKSINGKLVRLVVMVQAMKPKDVNSFVLNALMDTDGSLTREEYLAAMANAMGDDLSDVKEKAKLMFGSMIFDLDDEDYENILNKII